MQPTDCQGTSQVSDSPLAGLGDKVLDLARVRHALWAFARLQSPQGSFPIDQMQTLADAVADGQLDLLKSTLYVSTTQWFAGIDADIIIDGNRAYFQNWRDIPVLEARVLSELERARRTWDSQRDSIAPLVFARAGHRCIACGCDRRLTVDHIIPLARGGSSDLANLQALCRSCNSRKGSR